MNSTRFVEGKGALAARSRVTLETLTPLNFPDFVRAVLSAEFSGIKQFAAHKDGAIDLVFEDPTGRRTTFQCKSLSGATSSPRKAWKDEQRKLDESLSLDEAGRLLGEAQYTPWMNVEQPIVRYAFCHSKVSGHQHGADKQKAELEYLKSKIEAFFRKKIGNRNGFRHLANLEVSVYSGDVLVTLCEQQAKVCFDFFGPRLPNGITRVDGFTDEQNAETFQDYLDGNHLPYFSRREFKALAPGSWPTLVDETALLDMLFASSLRDPILIITGPGGYGKSRLTIELCRLAQNIRRCIAFKIDENVTADDVTALCRTVPGNLETLLWIDYVETQEHFEEIVRVVAAHNLADGMLIRIIANCRTSYYKAELIDVYRNVVDLASSVARDALEEYRRGVFSHIMREVGFKQIERFGDRCGFNPVLAALVLYVARRGDDDSELLLDLRKLVEEYDYQADLGHWLVKRLHRSVVAVHGDETVHTMITALGPVMALLPLSHHALIAIMNASNLSRYIEILIHDRLIEQRSDRLQKQNWVAVHDIIADHLLARCIGVAAIRETAVDAVFSLAERHGAVRNLILSFQRIAEHKAISDFSWCKFFIGRINQFQDIWASVRSSLLRTNLLSAHDKLALIMASPKFWSELVNRPAFSRHFTTLAYSYSKWRKLAGRYTAPSASSAFDDSLVPFLDVACESDVAPYYGLSSALRYNPEHFASKALAVIVKASPGAAIHHLFSAWLDAGLGPAHVRDYMLRWLHSCGNVVEAEFVYSAWLGAVARNRHLMNAHDSIVLIEPFMKSWLDHSENGELVDARFIFYPWLRAANYAGSVYVSDTVVFLHPKLEKWFRVHGAKPEASSVYGSWLGLLARRFDGEAAQKLIDKFEPYLTLWLAKADNVVLSEARIVYIGLVRAAARDAESARHVLVNLEPIMKVWLSAAHGTDPDAAYLYSHWLEAAIKAGRDVAEHAVEFLRSDMLAWVRKNDKLTDQRVAFLYASWLSAAIKVGPLEVVRAVDLLESSLQNWLKSHDVSHIRSEAVRGVWNKALRKIGRSSNEQPSSMEGASWDEAKVSNLLVILAEGRGSTISRNIIEHLSKVAPSRPEVIDGILSWLDRNRKSRGAHALITGLLPFSDIRPSIVDTAFGWLEENRDAPGSTELLRDMLPLANRFPEVITRTLSWLDRHETSPGTCWMLQKLAQVSASHPAALLRIYAWLDRYEGVEDTRPVHIGLLKLARQHPEIIDRALEWIEKRGKGTGVGDMLGQLLPYADIRPDLVERALVWLDSSTVTRGSEAIVINGLAGVAARRPDLVDAIIDRTIGFVDRQPEQSSIISILENILPLAADRPDLIDRAVSWYQKHKTLDAGERVLMSLLPFAGIREDILIVLCVWIDQHPNPSRTADVIEKLLLIGVHEKVIVQTSRWLDNYGDKSFAFKVVRSLLPASVDSAEAVDAIFRWLDRDGNQSQKLKAVSQLVWLAEMAEETLGRCLDWIERHCNPSDASETIEQILLVAHDQPFVFARALALLNGKDILPL